MPRTRTKNVSINMLTGVICQFLAMIANFVSRTVFIKTLGANYLGVNGLFSNILTIFSFAELGIGNAIVFSLYNPIALGNREKIVSLMDLYKKCYRAVGIFIAVGGACLTPFIGYIIKNKPDIPENLIVLYWLFLINNVVSYFFVYKGSLITADQKNYIVLIITQVVHIIQIATQIAFLYVTHNYILYLVLQVVSTLISNLAISVVANRLYPYLKQKAVRISREEQKDIFKNVRALALYRFGSVILTGTDNILISILVGIREVGLVSNYSLLCGYCNAFLEKITGAFTASVGNLNAISDAKKKYDIFNRLFLIVVWLYGFVAVGIITVANSLIDVWIGTDYLLNQVTVIAIVSETYFKGIQFAAYTYRTTLGYFVQSRYVPVWSATINIILSVLLYKWIGLPGIFFATPISRILGVGIADPYLIYTKTFHKTPVIYWAKYVGYTMLIIIIGVVCDFLIGYITISGWLGVIIKILAVTIIFNGIMLLFFGKTKAFQDMFGSVKNLVNLKRKNA